MMSIDQLDHPGPGGHSMEVSVIVVVLNTGSGAASTTCTVSNTGVSTGTAAPYPTNASGDTVAPSAITLADGSFTASAPARSLVTYRITGS